MKKKVLFLVPMMIVAVLLFMLRVTGVKVHIAVSVVGLVLLVAYTLATKKNGEILHLKYSSECSMVSLLLQALFL